MDFRKYVMAEKHTGTAEERPRGTVSADFRGGMPTIPQQGILAVLLYEMNMNVQL
jgi:hypothetical protein